VQLNAARFLDVVASVMPTKSNFYDENGVVAAIEAMSLVVGESFLKVLLPVDAGLPALEVKDRGGVLMVWIVCEKHGAGLHVIWQGVVD
jgi:hypothetical protein